MVLMEGGEGGDEVAGLVEGGIELQPNGPHFGQERPSLVPGSCVNERSGGEWPRLICAGTMGWPRLT